MYNLPVFSGLQENKSPSPHQILNGLADLAWTLFSYPDLVLDLTLLRAAGSETMRKKQTKDFGFRHILGARGKITRTSRWS